MPKRSATLIVLVVAIAGCGGSSSSGLTNAQLASKANAICAQRNAQITALPRSLANPSNGQAAATLLGDVLAIDKPLLAKLHALKPSGSDKAVWNQALAANDSVTQLITRARAAAQANNLGQFKQLNSQIAPLAKKLMGYETQLGLTECEKQPAPSK